MCNELEMKALQEELKVARESRSLFKNALEMIVDEIGCSDLVDASGHAPELPQEYSKKVISIFYSLSARIEELEIVYLDGYDHGYSNGRCDEAAKK